MKEDSSPSRYVDRPMAPGAEQRQWLEIKARRTQHRRGLWAVVVGGLALAAVALVAVGVTQGLGGDGNGETAAVELSPGVVLEAGERDVDVRLRDGSQVALARGARLVAERVEADEVRLSLRRGSARFDVARDPRRLFRVVAGAVDVRVIGTRFEVRRETGRVVVEVERGVVEVQRGEEVRRLRAGEQWTISEVPASLGDAEASADATDIDEAPEVVEVPVVEVTRSGPSAPSLFEAAREARRDGRDREAADLYAELLRRHPRDGRVGIAALELGRLRMDVLSDPQGAVGPFRTAASSAPGESLREDAMARLVEAYDRAGQSARCREARGRYLDRFPEGVHASAVVRRCAP